MSDVYRYFGLPSLVGFTLEVSLVNGAIFRGVLDEGYNSDNWKIHGNDGHLKTETVFHLADVRSVTTFR